MKPTNALRLTVDADLSQCSMENAVDVITKHFIDHGLERDGYKSVLNVSVDVEDLVRAIDLARAYGMRLQLKRTYEWDEWSIDASVKESFEAITVWSPGA